MKTKIMSFIRIFSFGILILTLIFSISAFAEEGSGVPSGNEFDASGDIDVEPQGGGISTDGVNGSSGPDEYVEIPDKETPLGVSQALLMSMTSMNSEREEAEETSRETDSQPDETEGESVPAASQDNTENPADPDPVISSADPSETSSAGPDPVETADPAPTIQVISVNNVTDMSVPGTDPTSEPVQDPDPSDTAPGETVNTDSPDPAPSPDTPSEASAPDSPETTAEPMPEASPAAEADKTPDENEATSETDAPADELSVKAETNTRVVAYNGSVELRASISGGRAPYHIEFTAKQDGESVFEVALDTDETYAACGFHPEKSGTAEFELNVKDANGTTAYDSCEFRISDNEHETEQEWVKSISVALTGDFAIDLINVARTQVGYCESTTNIAEENGKIRGYTRYGDYIGALYTDWCAAFVSFSVHYAHLPFAGRFHSASVVKLHDQAVALGAYHAADGYDPHPGDVVFFKADKNDFGHIGIVESVSRRSIQTIEGNIGNQVAEKAYERTDPVITGYFSIQDMMRQYNVMPQSVPMVEDIEIPASENADGSDSGEEDEPEPVDFENLPKAEEIIYGDYETRHVGTALKGSVNVRQHPDIRSRKQTSLGKKGSQVTVLGYAITTDKGEIWYLVDVGGVRGYVLGEFLEVEEDGLTTPPPETESDPEEDGNTPAEPEPTAQDPVDPPTETVRPDGETVSDTDSPDGSQNRLFSSEDTGESAELASAPVPEVQEIQPETVSVDDSDSPEALPAVQTADPADAAAALLTDPGISAEVPAGEPEPVPAADEEEPVLAVVDGSSAMLIWKTDEGHDLFAIMDYQNELTHIVGLSNEGICRVRNLHAGAHPLTVLHCTIVDNILIYGDAVGTITVEIP